MSQTNNTSTPKKKGKIATFFKETKSEMKKISWPTVKKVIAQTGVVLAVVAFFLVVVTIFDIGLSALLKLIVQS